MLYALIWFECWMLHSGIFTINVDTVVVNCTEIFRDCRRPSTDCLYMHINLGYWEENRFFQQKSTPLLTRLLLNSNLIKETPCSLFYMMFQN